MSYGIEFDCLQRMLQKLTCITEISDLERDPVVRSTHPIGMHYIHMLLMYMKKTVL